MNNEVKTFKDVKPGDVVYLAVNGEEPQVKEVTIPYVFTLKEYFKHIFNSDEAAEAAYQNYIRRPYNDGDDVMFFWFPDQITISDDGQKVWDGFIRVNKSMWAERGVSDFTDKDSCLSCSICTTRELAVDELRGTCCNELRVLYKRMKSLNDRYEQLRRVLLYKEEYQLPEEKYEKITFASIWKESPMYVLYKTYNPFELHIRKLPWVTIGATDTEDNTRILKFRLSASTETQAIKVGMKDTSVKCFDLSIFKEKFGCASEVQLFTTFGEAKETALKYWKFITKDCVNDTSQAHDLMLLVDLEYLREEDINDL